ncbi:MAG TPA: hypothetical protein VGD05_06940 [Pyrinomonadaceae bacterium]|jgi:hypothetical protein
MTEDKPYKIKMENREGYLYAFVGGGMLTPEISCRYWDEIADECKKLVKTKIMIEKDFSESVSAPEMLEMGVYLGKILASKKIAFLDLHGNAEINELGKTIARQQGVQMKVFDNVNDAEKWLII